MANTTTLTPKQEQFCHEYLASGNASAAYRVAYEVAEKTKPESVNRSAKEMLDNPKISSRLTELRQPAIEKCQITVLDLIRELEEARVAALTAETPQASAAAAATLGKAKLLGLDKQVVEQVISGNVGVQHTGTVTQRVAIDFESIRKKVESLK